jgi:hypothetical protein
MWSLLKVKVSFLIALILSFKELHIGPDEFSSGPPLPGRLRSDHSSLVQLFSFLLEL